MSGQNKVAFGSLVTGAAFSVEADGDVLVKIAVDTGVSLVNGSAKDSRPFGFEVSRLVCPRHVAVVSNHEPVSWSNGCNTSVPAALRYLANHDRPIGGSSRFNSEHLLQLADEIERMASKPLFDEPKPLPDTVSAGKFRALVEHCKRADKRLAELTSQLNMVRLYEQKEVWYWQGDGEDHLGSLVCPVVINAEDLRELLRKAVAAVAPDPDRATLAPAVELVRDQLKEERAIARQAAKKAPEGATHCAFATGGLLPTFLRIVDGLISEAWVAGSSWDLVGPHYKYTAESQPNLCRKVIPLPCDGNHGGPRCADPECWIDEAAPGSQSEGQVLYAIPCRKHAGSVGSVPACRSDCTCEGSSPALAVTEWKEKGLPPIGTVCEIAASTEYLTIRYPEGVRVKIYAHFIADNGKPLAAFVSLDFKLGGVGFYKVFRPILTPEQIAAEERIKAAQEWLKGVEREYGVEVADECENILMAAEAKRVAK